MKIAALYLLAASCLFADTSAFFQNNINLGPFPTDALTVASSAQKTGRQINFPVPPFCGNPALSLCTDAAMLNQLDGFSVNPMIVMCFTGPVDINSLSTGVQIYPLSTFSPAIGINRILFDPLTNCMFAKPLQVLDEHSRYFLSVTDAVRDTRGIATTAGQDFKTCLRGSTVYCGSLVRAINQLGINSSHLIAASVFTTLSATDWLEKARAFEDASTTPAATIPGQLTPFPIAGLNSFTWIPQGNPSVPPQTLPLSTLAGVDKVAFGAYLSPNFLNLTGPLAGSITVTPTGGPIQPPVPIPGLANVPPGFEPVSFHVFLPPASKMPQGGFPVVIYGHGIGDNQFGAASLVASTFAASGIATLAIEITGHGYGPGSTVQLGVNGLGTVTIPTPGRGILIPGNTSIGATDGCILPGPLAIRDCGRQTAVDLYAMVKTIKATSGLGLNINPARIYYVGQSFGALYGSLFHATEPAVKAAVLNMVGGTEVDVSRLSPTGRPLADAYLGSSIPSLLNVPPAPPENYFHDAFNDNYVFRDDPPRLNTVFGAVPIQIAFEIADWLDMNGDPLAYAPHLKNSPLTGVPPKSTLIQFGYGDLEVPNPTNSAFIRAAGLQSNSWFYQFNLAVAIVPGLAGYMQPGVPYPVLPHRFLTIIPTSDAATPAALSVATAGQQQIAGFLTSDGDSIPDPNPFLTGAFTGVPLFQVPATLPETLNFIQIPK